MRLALFGDPVAGSRSPEIHTAALAEAGIEGSYEAVRIAPGRFSEAVDMLRSSRFEGANVTMPHKAAAAGSADLADEPVVLTGAANTLRVRDGRLEASNTDVGGIIEAATRAGLPEAPVLILGSGGAGSAARVAFRDRPVTVSGRSHAGHPWGDPLPGAIVVNATPLGMKGESLPEGVVEEAAGLIDMPYRDDPTPAVTTASEHGLPYVDGLALLVEQAALSFAWWTGVEAPVEAMRRAVGRG